LFKSKLNGRKLGFNTPLSKTSNAILGPSTLPAVVAQPDKRLQTGSFCVGVVWQTQSIWCIREKKKRTFTRWLIMGAEAQWARSQAPIS